MPLPNTGSIFMEREGDFIAFSDVYWRGIYDGFKVKPGFVVIDVGAHIGIYTIKAARSVGSNGRVIAVEPHPENFRLMLQNIALNKLDNVTPVQVALSNHEGYVKLYLSNSSDKHSIVYQASAQCMKVPSLTLDGLLRHLDIDYVDLIKIDVEGAEMDVLEGARQTLKKSEKIVVATYHYASEPREVAEYLTRSGFEIKEVPRNYTLLDSIYGASDLTHLLKLLKRNANFFIEYIILRTFFLMRRGGILYISPFVRRLRSEHARMIPELIYAFKKIR